MFEFDLASFQLQHHGHVHSLGHQGTSSNVTNATSSDHTNSKTTYATPKSLVQIYNSLSCAPPLPPILLQVHLHWNFWGGVSFGTRGKTVYDFVMEAEFGFHVMIFLFFVGEGAFSL